MLELLTKQLTPPQPMAPEYVGGTGVNNSTGAAINVAIPGSYQPGDLLVVAEYGQSNLTNRTIPSGYTEAFLTEAGADGYKRRVYFKTITNDTLADVLGGSGFDQAVLVFRNATTVKTAHQWLSASGGQTKSFAAVAAGTSVVVASDRGAAGYPSVGLEYLTASFDVAATYFKQKTGVYVNHPNNAILTFKDSSDPYATNGLLFQVK